VAAQPAPAARAGLTDTTVVLPITGAAGKVVDAAHGHLFISDGVSQILVTDLAGHPVTTIGSEPGAGSMALSQDGDTLYVTDSWSDATPNYFGAIAAIDTRTLRETARYPLPTNMQPSSVAFTGGKLWFGYQVTGKGGGIGAVDPGAATPTATVGLAQDQFGTAPTLGATPGAPNQLVAIDAPGRVGGPGAEIRLYDVSQGIGGALPPSPGGYALGGAYDMSFNPDGSEFAVADINADIFGFTGSTFHRGQYAVGSMGFGWSSVAVAPGGAAAIGGGTHNDVRQIEVHPKDAPRVVNAYTLPLNEQLQDSGLAWSPDAGTLYAFSKADGDSHLRLHLIQGDPTHAVTTARLSAPASVQVGRSFTLSGALDPAPFYPGTQVTITRTSSVDHGTVLLPVQTLSMFGRYQFTDTLPVAGSYTYTATFAGDAALEPATVSTVVQATGVATTLTVRPDAASYDQGATAHVTAHLGTTTANRYVAIYAQPADGSPRKLVAAGNVDAHGNLNAAYKVSVNTTFTAVYSGDAADSPASANTLVGVRIGLRETLSGGYMTARYGSTPYAVFHHIAALHLALQTTPVKNGNCLGVQVQQYVSGAWRTRTAVACVATHMGKASCTLSLRGLSIGGLFRIAASWTPPRGEFNIATTGAWQYFTVRR
jgi:hypothetical protein